MNGAVLVLLFGKLLNCAVFILYAALVCLLVSMEYSIVNEGG